MVTLGASTQMSLSYCLSICPSEIRALIFSYVIGEGNLGARLVCKQWRKDIDEHLIVPLLNRLNSGPPSGPIDISRVVQITSTSPPSSLSFVKYIADRIWFQITHPLSYRQPIPSEPLKNLKMVQLQIRKMCRDKNGWMDLFKSKEPDKMPLLISFYAFKKLQEKASNFVPSLLRERMTAVLLREDHLALTEESIPQSENEFRSWTQMNPHLFATIRVLFLHALKLDFFPFCFPEFTQLEELHLWDNQLISFPLFFLTSTNLKTLSIDLNQIKKLTPEIKALTNLESLNLSWNMIDVLPPEIGDLTKLKSLNISANRLKFLPPEIHRLGQLQSLEAYKNSLTTLPEGMSALTRLEKLNIIDNPLTSLPAD